MKILYAIQGTGNGHLSRARDIIPLLEKKGELDILISGIQADVELPAPPKYRFKGLSFIFGKKGGVDLFKTYKKSNLRRLLGEINSLQIDEYDLVINDFEPVSAWACYIKGKPCISLSHQAAVLNANFPQPVHNDMVGKTLLKYYAPVSKAYGFHFYAADEHISTPVIRSEIRSLKPSDEGHYTVYLPAYDDERLIKVLSRCGGARWEVFSKHSTEAFSQGNVSVTPINNERFVKSLASCAGVICGAGFETPAEAMFLGKKLMVIPMKNQYEQHCNAAVLEEMGVPVLKSLKAKHCEKIAEWIRNGEHVPVEYPDVTERIIDTIISESVISQAAPENESPSVKLKQFRRMTFKRILHVLGVNEVLA